MQRFCLGSKSATKPAPTKPAPTKPLPTWGIGKFIPAPQSKSTTRSYQDTMPAYRKDALETIHSSSDKKHDLQLRLRTLKETKGVDASREKDIKALEGEIKTLEDIIKAALTKVSP